MDRKLRLMISGVSAFIVSLPVGAAAQATASYTGAQAQQGEAVYQSACARCHRADLGGDGDAPPLTGPGFVSAHGNRPAAVLAGFIRTTMPPGRQGTLTEDEYLAITAYLMRLNGIQPGAGGLSYDSDGGLLGAVAAITDDIPPRPGRPSSVPSPWGLNEPPEFGEVNETPTGITRTYTRIENFTPVTDAELQNPPAEQWLNPRWNLRSWGYSPLDQLNTENVNRLELAWVWGMEDGIRTQPTPLVRDGVMFLPNWGSVVQALDATTGTLLWEYRRNLGPQGPIGRGRSRTIAIWEDLIIVSTADAHIIALDARTGVLRWETALAEPRQPAREHERADHRERQGHRRYQRV